MYLIKDTKDVTICVSMGSDFEKCVIKGEVSPCDMGQILCIQTVNNFEYQALTNLGKSFNLVVTVKSAFFIVVENYKFGVVEVRRAYRFGRVKNNSLYNGGRQKVFCRYRL